MESNRKIFISYAREDKKVVEVLYSKLVTAGYEPFLDTRNILPGEEWEIRINKEIKEFIFFIIVLSTNSVNKRGYLQKEIRQALEMWSYMLDNDIYLIPVRIEECSVPDKLARFQWVDLFKSNGYEKLMASLESGLIRRGLYEKPQENEGNAINNKKLIEAEILRMDFPISIQFVLIPDGDFLMGSDATLDKYLKPDEQPRSEVNVSGFWISKYPITNNQYQVYTKETGIGTPLNWVNNEFPIGRSDHPVFGISWQDAQKFCKWFHFRTGKEARLPTEAEWEKSSRGTDSRIYPWGNRWFRNRANCLENGIKGTTEVGHFSPKGDSPYGVLGYRWQCLGMV